MVVRCALAAFLACVALVAVSAADATTAEGGCTLVKIAEWPLRPEHRWPIVDGAINDVPYGVLIDTGAMRTSMARSTAVSLGLRRRPAAGVGILGVGGTTTAEVTLVDKL